MCWRDERTVSGVIQMNEPIWALVIVTVIAMIITPANEGKV